MHSVARPRPLPSRPGSYHFQRFQMRDAHTETGSFEGARSRHGTSRREFLRFAGLGGAAILLPSIVTGCSESPIEPRVVGGINLGTEDGLLDFAYLLTQMKAQFSAWVWPYSTFPGITQLELAAFRSIKSHVDSQKLLFYRITDEGISESIEFRFDGTDFSQRESVYALGINLFETTAAAFPWLAARVTAPENVLLLSKLSSVHARHAAAIGDLADITAGRSRTADRISFAPDDAVSPTTGLHRVIDPREAWERVGHYVVTKLTLRGI